MKKIRLFIYHTNEDDPKKCSAKKLRKFGFAELEKNIRKLPKHAILLNPFAEKSLSQEDVKTAKENGILAVDCSWKNAEKCFDYSIEIASKFQDGEIFIYAITNIYDLLQKNGLKHKFIKYVDLIILNEEIIVRSKSNVSKIMTVLLKYSLNAEISNEVKNKINDIIQRIEGRL